MGWRDAVREKVSARLLGYPIQKVQKTGDREEKRPPDSPPVPLAAFESCYNFLQDKIIPRPSSGISNPLTYLADVSNMYRDYRKWCVEKKVWASTYDKFTNFLMVLFPDCDMHAKSDGGHPRDVLYGVRYVSGGVNEEDFRQELTTHRSKNDIRS